MVELFLGGRFNMFRNFKDKKDVFLNDLKNKRAIIPNMLSVSRAFAPFVILPLTFSGNWIGALLAAGGFAVTDFLDGKVARLLNAETELGRVLDSVADKLFSIGLLLPLIPECPLLTVPLVLEGTIAFINAKSFVNGGNPKTKFKGKVKIWTLSAGIISTCVSIATKIPVLSNITNIFIGATALLQLDNIREYSKAAKENKDFEDVKIDNDNLDEKNIDDKEDLSIHEQLRLLYEERARLTECKHIEKTKTLVKK